MADEVQTQVPIEPAAPHTPELNTQIQPRETPATPEPKADAKPEVKAKVEATAGDAVKRAMQAVRDKEAETNKDAKPTETKPVSKPEPTAAERQRAQDGKFASTNQPTSPVADQRTAPGKTEGDQTSEGRKPYHEPPARFNETGKRDWANAPDSVKEEVHRAISENEKGIAKFKESADRYEKVREYDDLARKNGREGVHESLKQVVEIEQAFQRNPVEGLKKIADHFGLNLQAVAAHIMGQNPNQQVSEAHGRVRELEAKIAAMEQEAAAPKIVQDFFSQHDDAEAHADNIAFLLKNGIVQDLEAAYEYSKRFTPASNPGGTSGQPLIPAESATAQTQAPALNPAGSKSVSGAPAGGVSPASRQPASKSNGEAVRRAMANAAR